MTNFHQNLLEIRHRLIVTLIFFCITCLVFFFWANPLFLILIHPIEGALSTHHTLIATQMTSTLWIPLQVVMDAALLCTLPFALIQIWFFTAAGLYQHEKKLFIRFSLASIVLFCCGMSFCYWIVLPFMFKFFAASTPKGITLMPDIIYATNFISRMLWLFGLTFQLPLVCILLVKQGLVTRQQLKQIRPYIIVGAFIIGMLLTPPDVFSQLMLAIPLCILYELGIICSSESGE